MSPWSTTLLTNRNTQVPRTVCLYFLFVSYSQKTPNFKKPMQMQIGCDFISLVFVFVLVWFVSLQF